MEKNNALINFRIALYQPEIPSNTGNIGRLCIGSNSELHIIKPMRFLITDKHLKRAGLDYWDNLKPIIHEDYQTFLNEIKSDRNFYFSTKGENYYNDMKGDTFIFGPETSGIPLDILHNNQDRVLKIPMSENIRSINLANSVAIVLYEALRQIDYKNLK